MDIHFADNKLRILRLSRSKLWRFIIVDKRPGKRLLSMKLALSEIVQLESEFEFNASLRLRLRPELVG